MSSHDSVPDSAIGKFDKYFPSCGPAKKPQLDETTREYSGWRMDLHSWREPRWKEPETLLVRTNRPNRGSANSATAIPLIIDSTGIPKTMVLIQNRYGGWNLEFPAGLTESNETVEETAKREMGEEVGLRVGDCGITSITTLHRLGPQGTDGVSSKDAGCTDTNDAPFVFEVKVDGVFQPQNLKPALEEDEEQAGLNGICVPWAELPNFVDHCIARGHDMEQKTGDSSYKVKIDAAVAHASLFVKMLGHEAFSDSSAGSLVSEVEDTDSTAGSA